MSLWAVEYIEELRTTGQVICRPFGRSMEPIIMSGQRVRIQATDEEYIEKGDVILCKVNGQHYLHKVLKIANGQFLIGNNHGKKNGWIKFCDIYGKVTKIGEKSLKSV